MILKIKDLKSNTKSKSNKQFAILSAIGIVMVVSAHCSSSLNIMSDFFPYNSFFMPMFVFISGYFFKDESTNNIKRYLIKKTKNALGYYFIWNFIYGLIRIVFFKLGYSGSQINLNVYNLFVRPFIDGHQFAINSPAWFLTNIYLIEIAYLFIRKLELKIKCKIEYVNVAMFLAVNMIVVYIAKNSIIANSALPVMKVGFFMIFFIMGRFYKEKIERVEGKISTVIVFGITIAINLVMIKLYNNISFISLYNLKGFYHLPIFAPILTSITGIWFWLRISKIITPIIGKNKYINEISNHTKDIMMHHIFCIYMINFAMAMLKDIIHLDGFDLRRFINANGWYMYYPGFKQFGIIYIVGGIIGSILICEIQECMCNIIKKKFKRRTEYVKNN